MLTNLRNKLRLIPSALLLMATGSLFTGCQTSTSLTTNPNTGIVQTNTTTTFLGTPVTPAAAYAMFRGGIAQASLIALRADANTLPYLRAMHDVLEATITTGTYDPQQLQASISALPVKQIHNPAALEAIAGGFALFQMVAPMLQANVDQKNPFVIPVLQGIADGINDALALVGQSTPTPQPAAAPAPTPPPAPPAAPAPAPATTNAPTATADSTPK